MEPTEKGLTLHPVATRVARLPVFAVLLTLLLAGCTGSSDDKDEPAAPSGAMSPPEPNGSSTPTGPSVDPYGVRPLWFPGLRYEYRATFPAADVTGDLAVTVIGQEGALQLTMDGDEDAIMWALFYHLPPVGHFEAATFAPILHEVAVPWFSFPLSDGKTWSGPDHRGTTVNYTANRVDLSIPDGRKVPGYDVVGERGGITWVHYQYTTEIGWFTLLEVDGNGNGDIDARVELQDAVVYADHGLLTTFLTSEGASFFHAGPASNAEPVSTFTVPADANKLYVFFAMSGGPGIYSASVTFPTNNATVTRQYNWTNTDQAGTQLFGEHFSPTPGSGETRSIIVGEGGMFAEVVPVSRIRL